jgi:hypothetical protein
MKRFLLVLAIAVGLLSSCSKVDPKALAYEQLDALKPCILDIIVYQSITAGTDCAIEAIQEKTSEQLVDVLELYLAELPSELELTLLDLFNVDDVRKVAVILVEYLKIERQPETYTFVLPGFAYAQDVSTTDTPKDIKDIKALLSPQTIALLLLPLTMFLTYLAKTFVPGIQGIVTILVNAAMNAVSTGLTMYLGGGATLGYIVLFVAITFVSSQATYWFVIKPEQRAS